MVNMTIEDIKEFKRNAIEVLEKNTQYATARVTEEAFNLLIWFKKASNAIKSIPSYHEIPLSEDIFTL